MNDELAIIKSLQEKDYFLKQLVLKCGFLSLDLKENVFEFLIFNFIGQMLSNKAAYSIYLRLVKLCGGSVSCETILNLNFDDIKGVGISKRKVTYIKELAIKVLLGEINLNKNYLSSLGEIGAKKYLLEINGVGEWTADMVLLFSLGFENIFSWKDVALKNGILKTHKDYKTLSKKRFERLRRLYSPYCSYASLYYYWANDNL